VSLWLAPCTLQNLAKPAARPSSINTAPPLVQEVGLKVSDVVVLIDREQGGAAHLAKHSLRLHAAFTLSFIVNTLLAHRLLTNEVADAVKAFVAENQTTSAVAGARDDISWLACKAFSGDMATRAGNVLRCDVNLHVSDGARQSVGWQIFA
jgi:hypothetical protein